MAFDVIIAGGGPVGLFLATELRLRNVSVLILEKADDRHAPMKAGWMGMRGLNEPSLTAFSRRGLMEAVHDAALMWAEPGKGNGSQELAANAEPKFAGHFAAIPIDGNKIKPAADPYRIESPAVAISMEDLEAVLEARAETSGAVIRRGAEVTDISQDQNGVTVHAGEDVFRAKWLVGCDGARSIVRKQADFAFEGTEPQLTGYLASAEIADPEKLNPGFNLTRFGMYALGPGPDRVAAMEFDGGTYDRSKEVTLDHLQTVLRNVSGTDVTISRLNYASSWTDRARQATTYRNGRVLLAGDAAHIHSPLGAQGLNAGLADAINLGWKLAAAVNGWAPGALLDSYTSERHPAGAWALAWTRAQVAIMRPDPWGHAIADVLRDLINTRDGATYFAGKTAGSWHRYDLPGDHPLIGRSAPDLAFADGSRLATHMRDGKALLLDLGGGNKRQDFGAVYSDRLKVISAKPVDATGIAALFIRPDGIVAWAEDDGATSEDTTAGRVLRTWLGEPSQRNLA